MNRSEIEERFICQCREEELKDEEGNITKIPVQCKSCEKQETLWLRLDMLAHFVVNYAKHTDELECRIALLEKRMTTKQMEQAHPAAADKMEKEEKEEEKAAPAPVPQQEPPKKIIRPIKIGDIEDQSPSCDCGCPSMEPPTPAHSKVAQKKKKSPARTAYSAVVGRKA